jgi:DNA/RNA-binding domain of Phe-tRNA-synthetase-like protein
VPPALELRVDDEVREILPTLRMVVLRFTGARIGMANRKLEPLRDRVLASARERMSVARDVRRIRSLATFHQAFPEVTRGGRSPWLDEAFRAIARRDPFRVMNDAIDAARLLAFHHAVPVSAHDAARIQGALTLGIAPPRTAIRTLEGESIDAGGLPVLRDSSGAIGGVIGSPFFESQRMMPSTRTQELLFVAYDPGGEEGLDAADFQSKAENWLTSLSGARFVSSFTSDPA